MSVIVICAAFAACSTTFKAVKVIWLGMTSRETYIELHLRVVRQPQYATCMRTKMEPCFDMQAKPSDTVGNTNHGVIENHMLASKLRSIA